ncbi:hypothetical protein HC031_14140 [Planosporangium thailandense]|uniref:AAA+ ATPase domain-containing protein n=1 Tax=Planosporangium thailandense TaxID=765197 RepID=A0ABX0XYH7_9ACTN|nr:hypothetical protein [Planosporangium thailandense]NJC70848.1 hypothetical protein [Planosporangium thailandense]
MTSTMKGFRCWNAGSVRQTVYSDIGALPSDADAVFLAAHTPVTLAHPRGEELPGATSGERQVLDALLASVGDVDRNTIVAVTGGSGTGKSHIVRWVNAHLDASDARFHVLYVPRAVQSIRELLRRLVVGLPDGGGKELLTRIDAAIGNTNPAELQDRLLEEMRLALTWTLEPQMATDDESAAERAVREERNSLLGEPDEQGKRRDGLADLLALPEVNRALLRPEGRLYRLVQSLYSETSRRDEQQEAFTPADLPLRQPGLRRALAGKSGLIELWDIICHDPRPALDLLDEALRSALPRTLGLRAHNGETLDLLFRRSRQTLRDQGKELVLLFEDLAQFGLIDGELYDQFTIQPGSDLAPLRVLFAVTDGPYDKLPLTVQTRISHRFIVNSSALQDREAFVARYLNLVRVGRAEVETRWSQAQDSDTGDWVRNACDTREDGLPCQFRDECHKYFGAVEVAGLGRVGLYPYNGLALRRALDARGPSVTPRDALDVCVSEVLIEADAHIGRGTYPHERVRERFDFKVQRAKDVVLGGRTGEQAERLYRALVVWGDETELAPVIAEAFSLEVGVSRSQGTPALSKSGPQTEPRAATKTSSPSPLPPLFQWRNDDHLADDQVDFYRACLLRLVNSRLDLDQDLFHTANGEGAEILTRLFNRMSFDFPTDARGRRPGAGTVTFPIQRNDDDVRVLVAARWFDEHGHWDPERGTWPWPDGHDPVDLMLALECRLEQWANEVRVAFLSKVAGRDLARTVVGTRAVALIASGMPPHDVSDLDRVLSSPTSTSSATPAWASAWRAAAEALRKVSAVGWVGQFAAVRQGDRGGPQLIDAAELTAGLQTVLRSPVAHLRRVVEEFNDSAPVVASAARDLLSAVEQDAPSLLRDVTSAVETLAEGLEHAEPRAVAKAAREVGRRARDSGLFRPADGWNDFAEALDTLEALPAGLPLDWRRNEQESEAAEALAVEHWAGSAIAGALALQVVRNSMAATRQECVRSNSVAGDVDQRRREVRKKLKQVEEHLQALGTSEVRHG